MKDNTAWMQTYSTEHRQGMSWVSADGSWGSSEIYVFPTNALTEQQLELLAILPDYEKIHFVHDVIEGEDLSDWEDN